jgi:hypothetical protein
MAKDDGKGGRNSRRVVIIAVILAVIAAVAFLFPTLNRPGQAPSWHIMPANWFERPIRLPVEDWPASGPQAVVDVRSAKVVVVPQARSDIQVGLSGTPQLRVERRGSTVIVSDRAGRRWIDFGRCDPRAGIAGRPGSVTPVVTLYTPLDVDVRGKGVISGTIGPARNVLLTSQACGQWQVAQVQDQLRLAQMGEGRIHAAGGRVVAARAENAGRVEIGRASQGLDAYVRKGGVVEAGQVDGRFNAELWGKGLIRSRAGYIFRGYIYARGPGRVEHLGTVSGLASENRENARVRIGVVTGTVSAIDKDGGRLSYGRPAGRNYCAGMSCKVR